MISAATGAMALLMVTLVKDHGLQYLFATTILTGIVQIIFGVFKLSSFSEVCSEICYEWFFKFTWNFSFYSAISHILKMQLGKCMHLLY